MAESVTDLRDVDVDKPAGDEQLQRVNRVLRDMIAQSFSYWQTDGAVDNHGGFGVVLRVVREGEDLGDLDDANRLFTFAYAYGSQARRFLNRALCKQRAALRTGKNTGDLAQGDFENVVTDEDMDGDNPQLGEYPHRGGVVVRDEENGKYVVYAAISGFSGRQDHNLAALLASTALDKLTTADAESDTEGKSAAAENVVAEG